MTTYSITDREHAETLALRVAVIELLRVVDQSFPIAVSLRHLAAVGMVKPDNAAFLSKDALVRERLTALIAETWP